jgi:hypothetical protein
MSESTSEDESTTGSDASGTEATSPSRGSEGSSDSGSRGITDDQLPDDLNPEKNPLAGDPEELDSDTGGQPGGPDASATGGAPGTGQPG